MGILARGSYLDMFWCDVNVNCVSSNIAYETCQVIYSKLNYMIYANIFGWTNVQSRRYGITLTRGVVLGGRHTPTAR